ncbi:class I glutamine amidotransferase-like protein [Gorgonomyces haynaldii]|nr:class I glutamine amidotransferase-like protein [Gorgonomyces haynaldii]
MEAVISIDVLRRAGIQVTVCGVDDGTIECSRQVKIVPDTRISQLENDYDLLVLPGGLGGAKTFSSDVRVQDLLQSFFESQKWIGIICASPISLLSRGLGKGRKITSHPSVKSQMVGYDYQEERVVAQALNLR